MSATENRLSPAQSAALRFTAEHGGTLFKCSERTYMALVRRGAIGSADRLPNGEGGISAITAHGCRLIGVDPTTVKTGDPAPYWIEQGTIDAEAIR
jgi:hypothetical protein